MPEKLDRRSRKTREALLRELIYLLNEKDIKDISVKELSERADINRGTFYLHYSDVFDMLDKVEQELFEEFNEVFSNNSNNFETNTPYPLMVDLFHQFEKHKDLCKVFLGPHGGIAFMNRMMDLVNRYITMVWEAKTHENSNLNFFNAFVVSGCVGVIKEWLYIEDHKKSPEEMAELCSQIILQAFDIFSE